MAIHLNRSELNFPLIRTVREKTPAHCAENPEKYRIFLYSIAANLGLSEKESKELAEYVCLIGERDFADQKEGITLKIMLAKILVHNCIFKISSSLFSQNANTADSFQTVDNYLIAPSLSKVPISFRIVYILFHSTGFTESEVAQILNITPIQVRERLAKAKTIIQSQRF
jgi:RNA polymerase sigma-70 factor (ECF subfamily)